MLAAFSRTNQPGGSGAKMALQSAEAKPLRHGMKGQWCIRTQAGTPAWAKTGARFGNPLDQRAQFIWGIVNGDAPCTRDDHGLGADVAKDDRNNDRR
jgi:hypothetical protein